MLLQRKFVIFFSLCVGVEALFLFFFFVCMSLLLVVCIIMFFYQVLKLLGLRKFGRPGPERPGDVKGGIARRKM